MAASSLLHHAPLLPSPLLTPLHPPFIPSSHHTSSLPYRSRSLHLAHRPATLSFPPPLCAGGQTATTTVGGVTIIEDVEALERTIQESGETLVVINVSTKTCGPCKLIYPKFVKLSIDYPDAVFLKINGDLNNDSRALMRKWGVRAVPTFKFFRNGNLIHSHTGANEDELRAYILTHYSASP